METLTIDLSKAGISDEQFYYICRQNEGLRFEMTAQGEMIVMSPVGGVSGFREASISARVWNWNEQTQLGVVFSSSTIFRLPDGAKRGPNVAWVTASRWNALSQEAQEKFPPMVSDRPEVIAPDFVIELRSRTDELKGLRAKMQEYIENGVRLGWLLNPQDQQVEVYQPNQAVAILNLPTTLSGGDVLPGFMLEVAQF
jgi:Uma2 family endonuclease